MQEKENKRRQEQLMQNIVEKWTHQANLPTSVSAKVEKAFGHINETQRKLLKKYILIQRAFRAYV